MHLRKLEDKRQYECCFDEKTKSTIKEISWQNIQKCTSNIYISAKNTKNNFIPTV